MDLKTKLKLEKSASHGQLRALCKYGRGNCQKEAAIKDNGLAHKFCEYHRQQANRIQRAVRRRKRALLETQSMVTGLQKPASDDSFASKIRKVQSEPTLSSLAAPPPGAAQYESLASPTLSSNASTASLSEEPVPEPPTDFDPLNPTMLFDFLQEIPLFSSKEDFSSHDQKIFPIGELGTTDGLNIKGSVSMINLSNFSEASSTDVRPTYETSACQTDESLLAPPLAIPTSEVTEDVMNNNMFFFNIEDELMSLPVWGSELS